MGALLFYYRAAERPLGQKEEEGFIFFHPTVCSFVSYLVLVLVTSGKIVAKIDHADVRG